MLKAEARGEVDVDLPDERRYEKQEHADLDEAMVEAVNRAKKADNEELAELLQYELGSLYHRYKIDE